MAKGTPDKSRNDNAGNGGDNIPPPASNGGSSTADTIGGVEIVDTAKLASEQPSGNGDGRKQRSDKGKPRGSRSGNYSGANQERDTLSVEGLEALLLSVHYSLSVRLSAPEIALSDKDAHTLAISWKEVERQYPKTRVPAKIACLINLGANVAYIYGSKAVAIRIRMQRGGGPSANENYSPPPPQQSSAANPSPAAATDFNFEMPFQPFGQEAQPPNNPIDFPITRKN